MPVVRRLLRLYPLLIAWIGRRRRDWIIWRTVVAGRLRSARLNVEIAPDVTFAKGVTITLDPGSRNTLRLGPGVRLLENVVIQLRGGTIELDDNVAVRLGSLLNVAGHLTMERNSEISYFNVVHCAERVVFAERAGASERVTVADSRHFQAGEHEWFYHNVETAPVHIGCNTWLATNVVVTAGVTVGDDTIIAANSVASRDIGDRVLAAGAPAKAIRDNPTREDWLRARDGATT